MSTKPKRAPAPEPEAVQPRLFAASRSLRKAGEPSPAQGLQDINELRLLLRGDSVIDWHRLDFENHEQVIRLLALNGLEWEDPEDQRRVEQLRFQAVRYIRDTLRLRLDESIAGECDPLDLFLIASGRGKGQRQACLLLKVMHILYHLDARELRTMLAIADSELFALVEESVAMMFDELRSAGIPVVEFAWSRKTRSSLLTKLMIKKQTSAARVFDRLRFRLVVEGEKDLERALHVMLRRCIPFNYVVPEETVNTLINPASLDERAHALMDAPNGSGASMPSAMHNEFSARGFRMLNFIADLPVRVDDLLWSNSELGAARGRVVFVLAEFQVMDRATATENQLGDSSHEAYKQRQHARVKERLLHRPAAGAPNSRPPESMPPEPAD